MNALKEEKIPILLATNDRLAHFKWRQDKLFERIVPNSTVTVIPATLFDVMRQLSGVEEGIDDEESEILKRIIPRYRAIILWTDCLDDNGVSGHIPHKDHPLSEFAPFLNYRVCVVPSGEDIKTTQAKIKQEVLEKKRMGMQLLTRKIKEKQPWALLFWFRGSHGNEWSKEMEAEFPVLTEFDDRSDREENFWRQWIHDVAAEIDNSK